jgi:hypothetical protein
LFNLSALLAGTTSPLRGFRALLPEIHAQRFVSAPEDGRGILARNHATPDECWRATSNAESVKGKAFWEIVIRL